MTNLYRGEYSTELEKLKNNASTKTSNIQIPQKTTNRNPLYPTKSLTTS